jgi:hypothetical protein
MKGSALANVIPRYLFGIRCTIEGWKGFTVHPSKAFLGSLSSEATAIVPINGRGDVIRVTYIPTLRRTIEVHMEAPSHAEGTFIPPEGYRILLSLGRGSSEIERMS